MTSQKQGDIKVSEGIFSVSLVFEDRTVHLDTEDVIDLYFIEDIFKLSMTGKLIFYDKYNFLELGPFTGNEQIIVKYGKNIDVEIMFDIWKVKEISMTTSLRTQSFGMIELYFVDPIFQQMAFRRYSRSWAGNTKISTIMSDILENMTLPTIANGRSMRIEESSNNMVDPFIMPYWTPQQTLTFLMKRATGNESGNSGYICYSNTHSSKLTTNLHTIDYLLDDKSGEADDTTYIFSSRDVSSINKILEWSMSGTDKLAHEYLRGGKFQGYDWSTKTQHNIELKYKDSGVKNMMMLGKKTLFPDMFCPEC